MASFSHDDRTSRKHAFRSELARWYEENRRDLPWRRTGDPYRIWLAEVMLQQTRVDQAAPYYERFVERLPSVEALAAASLDEVLLLWEGLGYYARARHLHKAARRIVADFDGRIPDEYTALRSLPGVGAYTAAAVASIAFGKPYPVLDGNVIRVLSRVFAVEEDVSRASTKKRLMELAGDLLDPGRPGLYNQSVMELGSSVCSPAAPACTACPVRPVCRAAADGNPESFPVKARRPPVPHYDVAVALIMDERRRVLIQRRPEDAMLGGLWEFPGGKCKPGEMPREACARELEEELGVKVAVQELFCTLSHAYSHFRITLHAFRSRIAQGEPRSLAGTPLRWVGLDALNTYAFPRANRRLVERLAAFCDDGSAAHDMV